MAGQSHKNHSPSKKIAHIYIEIPTSPKTTMVKSCHLLPALLLLSLLLAPAHQQATGSGDGKQEWSRECRSLVVIIITIMICIQ